MSLYPSSTLYPSGTVYPSQPGTVAPVAEDGLPPGIVIEIGGTALADMTDYAKSLQISRGKSRELDRFLTGSASITFTNQDRAFDPFYSSSPFFGDIVPRRNVKISTVVSGSTAVQFSGVVEDWNLDYDISGQSDASASCVDGFVLFGGQQLEFGTATAQRTGERIDAILDRAEVDWPSADRDIDTGAQNLGADVIEQGRETLDYLQLVAASEPGDLFMSKDNKVTFRDRNSAAVSPTITLSDSGTAIPYTDITVSYGTELLYNRAVLSNLGGTPQVAENATSIGEYGVSSLELNGLLIDDEADCLTLAEYIVRRYEDPELRFDTVSVQLAGMLKANQSSILGVELADVIRVEYQPNGIGDRISRPVQVIGIRHDIRPLSHQVTFQLASAAEVAFVFGGGTVAAEWPFSVFAGGTVPGSPFGL